MILTRRSFLKFASTLVAAPAIVKAENLMKIWVPPGYATKAIEPAYIAWAHPDLEEDLRSLPYFKPVAEYGGRSFNAAWVERVARLS